MIVVRERPPGDRGAGEALAIRIVPLSREHKGLLQGFRNQHPSLGDYLHRFALRHLEKDLLSRTYLAVESDVPRVLGYFSLATASVERAETRAHPDLAGLPNFPIPSILLARLAVDERAQGQGLGRYLFDEALGLTISLGRVGPIGFRLFVTDAIDETAARFYEHFGLVRLSTTFPCRMALDLRPLLRS